MPFDLHAELRLGIASVLLALAACGNEADDTAARGTDGEAVLAEAAPASQTDRDTAYTLIARAVERQGLKALDSAAVAFRFRDRAYRYQRVGGRFAYERVWVDTATGERVRDVLTNDTLVRLRDGIAEDLPEKRRRAFAGSVNSVIYFAFLPWALRDPGVAAVYEGRDTVGGRVLDRIAVTFPDAGEHADAYRYWLTPDGRELPYLAYAHQGSKAPRFREAFNARTVDGLAVRDYRNYTMPGKADADVATLADRFGRGELELLSVIALEEVRRVGVEEGSAF